jgi:hypothetical protein
MGGECLLALVRRRPGDHSALPEGLRPLPGPALLLAEAYTTSPVGPYVALAIAEPASIGLRPGLCLTLTAVNSSECRVAGRQNWGFPRELANLGWSAQGDRRQLVWPERGLTVTGDVRRLALPFLVPLRSLQRREDGPVLVGGWMRGLARRARVEVTTEADDPLVWMAGPHPGLSVASLRMTVRPARHPVGLVSSLQAPLRAPEPALSCEFGPLQLSSVAGGRGRRGRRVSSSATSMSGT